MFSRSNGDCKAVMKIIIIPDTIGQAEAGCLHWPQVKLCVSNLDKNRDVTFLPSSEDESLILRSTEMAALLGTSDMMSLTVQVFMDVCTWKKLASPPASISG